MASNFFPLFTCKRDRLGFDFRSQSTAWQTAIAGNALWSRPDLDWKGKRESRTLVELAFYRNGSPEHFGERFDDVKAQPDSAMDSRDRAINLTKLLKNNGQRFSRNTHPGIGNIKFKSFSISTPARRISEWLPYR